MNGRQFFKALRVVKAINLKELIKSIDFSGIGDKTQATRLGVEVLSAVLPEFHNAEKEIYEFIADIKNIDINEVEHMDFNDIIAIIKDVIKDIDIASFLKQAVVAK
jgi:hypothetical protein